MRIGAAGSWDLGLTPAEHDKAAEAMVGVGDRPVIAVSVGTKVQSKDWGQGELAGAAGGDGPEVSGVWAGAEWCS